jgi:predicted nucleic acid-binding protein
VCGARVFHAAVTLKVLTEARDAIARKLGEAELLRFYQQLAALNLTIIPAPSSPRIAECAALTAEKDAHVLAGALDSNATYLLTLDRRHLLSLSHRRPALAVQIMTPGDFLQTIARQS